MKFELKRPCKDCPFVVGSSTNISLEEDRIKEIVHSIVDEDASFPCHKTLGYDGKRVPKQHCAGASIFLERLGEYGSPNQIMRIAERMNLYNRQNMDLEFEPIIKLKDYY